MCRPMSKKLRYAGSQACERLLNAELPSPARGRRTSARTTTCAGRARMSPATAPTRTRSNRCRPLRRLLLPCFDDRTHEADAECSDSDYGNPRRRQSQQAGAICDGANDENHTDHVDKEVSHRAANAADVPDSHVDGGPAHHRAK